METATVPMETTIGEQAVTRRERYCTPVKFLLSCLLAACFATAAFGRVEVEDAVVKIYVTKSIPDYYHPWNMHGAIQITGSGAVIKGNRILSNAHVVSDHTFVMVRRHGDPQRYQASVEWISTAADLAILQVDDPDFFRGVKPIEFGGLPGLNQEVSVYGFPIGGEALSLTKGVLSRVEHQMYLHSSIWLLAGQIDAAINAGSSGGPVVVGDKLVGVVMQIHGKAAKTGYMVPVSVVEHFLQDIEDGRYDGIPSLGITTQTLENHAIKRRLGLRPGQTGVLVNRVEVGAPTVGIIEPGDVLLSVDRRQLADDGTVAFRPRQHTCFSYLLQKRQIGDEIAIGILRDGVEKSGSIKLTATAADQRLVPNEQYDVMPTYYIYGGAVFTPLSVKLLHCWGEDWFLTAPHDLVYLYLQGRRERIGQEVVVLLEFLPAYVNQGYHDINNTIIDKVNGRKIFNMRELVEQIEAESDAEYVEFEARSGRRIVLDRAEAADSHAAILEAYRIGSDRSPDLGILP